ncbi:MAG TPA: helical backbone metal receptor, partial [Ferruginibacter sp.]|nr:helical backbone metal receptor [Ferruginibacter sp.]
EQVEAIAARFPVWLTDVNNLTDACRMIRDIGSLTNRTQPAETLAHSIEQSFAGYQPLQRRKAVYLIWRDPYMTVGADTFIHDMLERAGWVNAFADLTRYPEITVTDIRNRQPDLLLLSSEPYPFANKHITKLKQDLPDTAIQLVDGEVFSWYGSRLRFSVPYFQQLNEGLSQQFGV